MEWDPAVNPFRHMVNGDDGLTRARNVNAQFHVEVLGDLGLRFNPVRRSQALDATFCSGRFWPVVLDADGYETWAYTTFPGKTLVKAPWFITAGHVPRDIANVMSGKYIGLLYANHFLPVVGDYLRRVEQLFRLSGVKNDDPLAEDKAGLNLGHSRVPVHASGATRSRFAEVYGLSMTDLDELEHALSRLPCLERDFADWRIDQIVEVDRLA